MGDLGPRNCALPNSSRVGGFQNNKSVDSSEELDYRELENSVKLLFVVPSLVCAMTTIIAQVNSAPTTTADALPPSASNTLAPVARQEGNATARASGSWLMTWTNEKGDTRHATLHIQQEGEALSGTANLQGGPMTGPFRLSGNVRGNRIVLSVKSYLHYTSLTPPLSLTNQTVCT